MIDIEGYKNYLYEEEMSTNTIDTYVRAVEQYSAVYDDINKPNLIEYKKQIIHKYKPKTVNLKISAILKYCCFKEIPMKIKQVKEPKLTYIDNVITLEQYDRLVSGLKSDGDIRWYINIVMIAKTGMRISEALRVTKKDLIKGSVDMPTKAHMRTIYFPQSLVDDIIPYLKNVADGDTVISNHKGQPITSSGYLGRLKEFAKKYDIPTNVMHPHSFRHFFAIEFLKRNNNISLLADLLGHGNVNVTQIYLRQSQEQQKTAIDKAVNW